MQFASPRRCESRSKWLDRGGSGARDWPVLEHEAVHVWRLPLGLSDSSSIVELNAELDDAERQRAGRFVFDRDRLRYIAAHAWVRRVLARYLGRLPRELRFEIGPHGKPELLDEVATSSQSVVGAPSSRVCFSLSHSDDIALLGVTRGVPIGVDVEVHRTLGDAEQIARANFSAREAAQLRNLEPADRLQGFFDCWTRKEAFVKALGLGLSMALDRFEVTIGRDQPPAVLSIDGSQQAGSRWTLLDGDTGPGTSSTIAVQLPLIAEVRFFASRLDPW